MLKNVWNRAVSAVLALAMFSCVLLPPTQPVYAANEQPTDTNTVENISEENTSALQSAKKDVIAFDYDGGDFSVKAEIDTNAVFSIEGLTLSADEVRLSASAIDKTDKRYSALVQSAENDELTLMPYDIYFCTEDGKKVDISDCDAEVSFCFNKQPFNCSSDEISVLHFTEITSDSDDEENISFESTNAEITKTTFVNDQLTDISFCANSFSVYGILIPKSAIAQNIKQESENAVTEISDVVQNLLSANADSETSTGHSIGKFELSFGSGAVINDKNQYVWTAENSNEGHGFIYNLAFSISTHGSLAPGDINIRIPKQILKDSSGNYAGDIQLPYPSENEDYDKERIEYVYREVYDTATEKTYIEIYNVKELDAINLEIPFMYETSEKTWEYEDMAASEPCQATVTVNNPKGETKTLSAETEEIPVYIDTNVKLKSTYKGFDTLKDVWSDNWGDAVKPDNPDDYVYTVWRVSSNITNVTQKYNFNITDTFNGLTNDNDTDGLVLGYKMKGNTTYTAPNDDGSSPTVENLTESGTRVDYVLTAYPKDKLPQAGEEEYTFINSVTATVDPADEKDDDTSMTSTVSQTFENEEPPEPTYNPPGESYGISKCGIYGAGKNVSGPNNISSYALESLKNGTALPGLTYHISASANAYIRTLEDGATGTEEDAGNGKFGQKSVTYSVSDSEIYLNDSTEPLSKEDYAFTSLEYTLKMRYATYDADNKSFKRDDVTEFRADDVLNFYVMTDDDADYTLAAAYNLYNGQMEIFSDSVASLTKGSVTFRDGVKGWKIETSNPYFTTAFDINPTITLNSTDNVRNAIGDGSRLAVNNKSVLTAAYAGTDPFISRSAVGTDYVAHVQRNSNISKRFVNAKNYPGQRCYKVNWETSISETFTDDDGTKPVRQESGVFYDLLPIGCRVDLDTVKVSADDMELTEGEYVIESTVENYKNSGRMLLTVRISEPADVNYKIGYTTVHLWEDILDNGRYVLNSIAYETGNEDIAGGYPDNGGKISDSTLLEELDPESDDKRFLYSQATHTINALIPYSSGITKKVASSDDASFGDETIVHQDSEYVYSIRMENSSITQSKDIIILDSIENFCEGKNGAPSDKTYDWQGTLQSFGLTNLISKGIDPVIYLSSSDIDLDKYSKSQAPDFFNEKDESGKPIWVKAEDFGDYSNAKAFAVDLSKKKDGTDFVLGPNESFSFTVTMRSPTTVDSEEIVLETYNNIYRSFTSIDTTVEGTELTSYVYTHYDYTTVTYRTVGTLQFKKIDSDTKEPIQGITFNLYGTSDYGTVVDKDIVTNSNGELYIANLERGTYVLSEIDPTVDYLPGEDRTVIVDENGNVEITPNDGFSDKIPIIENEPRIHGDLNFLKRNALDLNEVLLGAEFTLTGTSDYGNKIVKTAVSNGYGVTFTDVELGTYTLTETKAPENYIAAGSYTVRCDEDGILSIIGLPLSSSGDYVITDMPRQSFSLRKVDAVNQAQLQNAEFSLTSVKTMSGETISKTAASDMFGVVTFDGLDFGTYTLKETKAPKNHGIDTKEYTVNIELVNNQKVVTITSEGIQLETEAYTGFFVFPNERENNGTIRIIKKWEDDGTAERPTPVIHLSTEEPEVNSYKATINRELFKSAFPATATSIQRDYSSSLEDMDTYGAVIIGNSNTTDNTPDNDKDVYLYSIGTDYYIWSEAETIYLPSASNQLFQNYTALASADLSGLNSSKVTSMISMFNGCSALETVNLTGFDISNVTSIESMFQNCISITELDLSSFGTANALTDAKNAFNSCKKVTKINLSNFQATQSFNMQNMFSNCDLLETVIFNTQSNSIKPTDIYGLFYKCPALQTLNLSGFNTSSTTRMNYAFSGCNHLISLELGNDFVLTNVTTTFYMFDSCNVLTSLDCSCFGPAPNLQTTKQMFQNCKMLTSIDLSNFTTSTNLTDMYEMFGFCNSLTEVRFSNGLNTSNVTSFKYMFYQCNQLTELDLSMFNITTNENATVDMQEMFYQCSKLKTIYVSPDNWSTDRVTIHSNMFNGCSVLVGGNNTPYNSSHKDKEYARIDTPDTPGYLTDIADKPATTSAITEASENQKLSASFVNKLITLMPTVLTEYSAALAADDETTGANVSEGTAAEESVTNYISTEDATWEKTDDTWVCIFKVYDDEAEYYVWEDNIPGYQSDATKNDPKKVNADGNITQLQTITNTKTKPDVGDLKLSKTVTKGSETLTDDTTEFEFQITLSGEKITENQYFGSTEFVYNSDNNNAVATVKLTCKTPVTISGIPADTNYSIEEINVPYGYSSDTSSPQSGTIEKDTTKEVEWKNFIIERDKSEFHVSKTVELYKVVNQLDGTQSEPELIALTDEEKNQEFTFTATLANLDRNGTYTFKKGDAEQTFSSTTSGDATFNFTLKNGETADFTGIPVGATYQIAETDAKGYTPSYTLTDINNQGEIKSSSDNSNQTAEETLDSGEDVTAEFTNTKTITVDEEVKTIDVSINKEWKDDTTTDRPTSITVYLERSITLSEGFTTNQEICGTATLTANDGWQTTFLNLPDTDEQGRKYVYSISEDAVPGYECTNITKVTDETGNPTFTVTNTKQPTFDLSVTKTVSGVFGNKAKQYEFTVTLTDSSGKPLNGFYTLNRGGDEVQVLFDVNGKAKIGVSHGETVIIAKLPQGTKFTVTETDYSNEGYTTKSALGDTVLQENRTVSGELTNSNQAVKYENHRNGILPTGIGTDITALIMTGAVALGGIALLKKRKRKENQ